MTTLGPADRLAIRDLLIRYVHGVRTKQFDLLDDVFVEDAPVDFTAVGGSRARGPRRSPGSPGSPAPRTSSTSTWATSS